MEDKETSGRQVADQVADKWETRGSPMETCRRQVYDKLETSGRQVGDKWKTRGRQVGDKRGTNVRQVRQVGDK